LNWNFFTSLAPVLLSGYSFLPQKSLLRVVLRNFMEIFQRPSLSVFSQSGCKGNIFFLSRKFIPKKITPVTIIC
jgi:hypothetical protein